MANSNSLALLGFRFDPTDQELIGSFLHRVVVQRQPLPPPHNRIFHHCNLFGNMLEPSQIWQAYGGDGSRGSLYFLSEIKRIKVEGSKVHRDMGRGGTWTGKSKAVKIFGFDGNPNPIGERRTLRYENAGSEDHGGWQLDEYSLFAGQRNHGGGYDFDFVICRLRKNSREGLRKENSEEGLRKEEGFVRNKRKRGPTSSSLPDQASPTSNSEKKRKRCTNKKKKVNKDDQVGSSKLRSSSQHVNVITPDDINEEIKAPPQGSSCPRSDLDLTFYDESFTVDELLAESEIKQVPLPESSEIIVDGAVGEPPWSPSMSKELSAETLEMPLHAYCEIAADEVVQEEAWGPSFTEQLLSETQDVFAPTVSGIAADGAVQEEAWSPSFTEQLLAETQDVLFPTASGIMADGGGVGEAWIPTMVKQSLFEDSYWNDLFINAPIM